MRTLVRKPSIPPRILLIEGRQAASPSDVLSRPDTGRLSHGDSYLLVFNPPDQLLTLLLQMYAIDAWHPLYRSHRVRRIRIRHKYIWGDKNTSVGDWLRLSLDQLQRMKNGGPIIPSEPLTYMARPYVKISPTQKLNSLWVQHGIDS